MTASRDLFAQELACSVTALKAISGDLLYRVQFDLVCNVLDTVDQVADEQTATRIAHALATQWAGAPAQLAAAEVLARKLGPPNLDWLTTR